MKSYYKHYPNFEFAFQAIQMVIEENSRANLADLNKNIIKHFADFLGYQTQYVCKSDLQIQSKSNQMLIDICNAVGADTYLCGGGASAYQDEGLFKNSGINLEYQNFVSQPYGEGHQYLPGLSIIDYLMSVKCK